MASSSRAPIGTLPTVRIRHLPPPVPSRLLQALKPFRVVSLMVRPDPAIAAGDDPDYVTFFLGRVSV